MSMTQEHHVYKVKSFQNRLYLASKVNSSRTFGLLYDKIYREEILYEAWCRVKKNRGSCGVDKIHIRTVVEDIGEDVFLREIRQCLMDENYTASEIKRVYIPKDNGAVRPLGIPTLKDRVIQMAVKLIMEPIFEADFADCSKGFRPKRSNQQAAEEVHKLVNHNKWVVDVDLKSYFDTIPHDQLMNFVRQRIRDRRLLGLINQWLKAGILEEGKIRRPESGTPQGGVLSPLLSNIYLHEIDKLWCNNQSVRLVRYADDAVFLCRSEAQANWVLGQLKEQLSGLFLTLNEEKTKVCHVREGFNFLGFTYKEAYSYRSHKTVRIKFPIPKRLVGMQRKIKEAVKEFPLGVPLTEVIKSVNRKLSGWAQYFKIGNSYESALKLSSFTCLQLRIFWRRRKQRKDINGYQKWSNEYFYNKGLHYVPKLLR